MALIRLGRQSKLVNELIRPGPPPALSVRKFVSDRNDDFCRNSNSPFDRSVKILSFAEKFKSSIGMTDLEKSIKHFLKTSVSTELGETKDVMLIYLGHDKIFFLVMTNQL